ncbi:MAG: hypothetical protein ACKV22_32765 [Bryobacteraceae bacterium]
MTRALVLLLAGSALVWAQRPNSGPKPGNLPAELETELLDLIPITTGLREDDHPALAARAGAAWIAWVSYSETEGSARVFARSWSAGKWSPPVELSEAPGDYSKPAIAIDAAGAVWVAWPAQVSGNWDIYGRVLQSGRWGRTERWTNHAAPDILPALAASGARVLLVWQTLRGDSFDIYYRLHQNGAWTTNTPVTASAANDWEPVAVASSDGGFHVAWDSYRGGYDIFLRSLGSSGQWTAEIPVAASPRLENHASLSADARGRVWISWEIGPENWASDSPEGGLRVNRQVGLACLANGRLQRLPAAEAQLASLAGGRGVQAPAPMVGRDGKLRVFFRQPMNTNWLRVGVTTWETNGWAKPELFANSEGRIDQRVVAADLGDRLLVSYPAGSAHNTIYGKLIAVSPAGAQESMPPLEDGTAAAAPATPKPPRHAFRGYQLVWGDLHRHTDISEDGGIPDGSLIDAFRYAFDAAPLDFQGITDHTRYLTRRYNLWRIQQVSDLFYKPGAFVSMHAYERSQFSPWGHRNIVNLGRKYEMVPGSYDLGDAGVSPWGLFAALRGKQAISIPHTSAWGNKQVSWDYYDPEIERIVEIYQGLRSTYEYNGAPDPAGRAIYENDSKSFVWDALSRGRKMGFIASSDHKSTHMSFAALYVKNLDRESVFEALRARRTYAATDKIFVDFSIGGRLMGEEIEVREKPVVAVAVEGTNTLDRIDIVKNGKFVYTSRPGARKVEFRYRDEDWAGEEAYYYARVIQSDKMMAWASPIWVKRGR